MLCSNSVLPINGAALVSLLSDESLSVRSLDEERARALVFSGDPASPVLCN